MSDCVLGIKCIKERKNMCVSVYKHGREIERERREREREGEREGE